MSLTVDPIQSVPPLPPDAIPTGGGNFFSDLNTGLDTFFHGAGQAVNLYKDVTGAQANATLQQGTASTLSTPQTAAGFVYLLGQALSSPFVWILFALVLAYVIFARYS
jgi:hypothetical protein